MDRRVLRSVVGLAGPAAVVPAALAHEEGDVFLSIENGRIVTGLFQEPIGGPEVITPGVRVFKGELGIDVPNFADEPGFKSEPGTFALGTEVGFRITRALRQWNGSSFDQLANLTMGMSFGGSLQATSPIFDPLSSIDAPSFSIPVEPYSADPQLGDWHRHPGFTLNAPATDGVYLMELELFSTDPSVQASDFIWIVWGQNADEAALDAALEHAESVIPAPSAALVLVLGGGLALRRRR